MSQEIKKRPSILEIPIDTFSEDEVLKKISQALHQPSPAIHIVTVNPEMILESLKKQKFKEILQSSAINTPDGIGLIWAANFLNKSKSKNLFKKTTLAVKEAIKLFLNKSKINSVIKKRLTGADLMINIFEQFSKSQESNPKIFLLGAQEGVAKNTGEIAEENFPNIKIVGTHSGSPKAKDTQKQIELINQSKAQILFVAFGAPQQEIWINENLPKMPSVKVAIGVGGVFFFYSGKIKRAPKFMQELGIEWLYRLIQEPKKRAKRIFNAVIKFPIQVIRDH